MINSTFVLSNYVDIKNIIAHRPICNASLFEQNNELYLIGRETNYTFRNNNNLALGFGTDNTYTDDILYKFDDITNEAKEIKVLIGTTDLEKRTRNYCGAEDIRIIKWNGEYNISFSEVDNNHHFQINTMKMDNEFNVFNKKLIKTKQKIEKNWQPIEDMPETYIYSYKPYTLINSSGNFTTLNYHFEENYRGSSPVINFNNYKVALIHKSVYTPNQRNYFHYFIVFDNNLKPLKISKPFLFCGAQIEFNTSILFYKNKLRIVFSVYDNISYYCDIDYNLFCSIMDDKLNNNNFDYEMIHQQFYKDSITNNNIRTAIGMASFVNNPDIIEEAIKLNHDWDCGHVQNRITIQKQLIEKFNKVNNV